MPPSMRTTHPQHPGMARRFIKDVLVSMVQMVLLFLIFTSLFGRFEIHQTSMEPNFHEGQRVMVSQIGSLLSIPMGESTAYAATGSSHTTSVLRRGHVVVLYDTPQHDKEPLIKRLIGLPGETLEIRDGAVLINDRVLEERYLKSVTTSCSTYCGPLTLGPDEYFFMGDNRPVSHDSRSFGPIPADQIVGRVILRYWPLNEFSMDL